MEETSFTPLLVVIGLAFLVPLLTSRMRRVRIPTVVGEIVAGMVVGQSGLRLVGHDQVLEVLSLLGFAYLMFLSGLEVDFDTLVPRKGAKRASFRERLGSPLMLGLLAFALTLLMGLTAGWGVSKMDSADDPWLMALILSTTSLGLVVPVLKERALTTSSYGQALLVAAVVADFATMLLVSVYIVLHTQGLTPEAFLVLILFLAFCVVYRVARTLQRRFPGMQLVKSIAQNTAQIDVRGAFAIGLGFIALAEYLGIEMILGAFLGGSLISLLSGKESADLHRRLDVFGYAFFIPIFFVMVGVRFDLAAVLGSPRTLLLVPLLLFLAYAIKFIASLLLRLTFSWRETLAGGALLDVGIVIGGPLFGAIVTASGFPALFAAAAAAVVGGTLVFLVWDRGR